MLEQQELKIQHGLELLRSSIASQEIERTRIAHDIHDEIGALLTTSRIYFQELKPGQSEQELRKVSDKILWLFDEIAINIRRISHDLRPVILENLGLIDAIESMHEKLESSGIDFYFKHKINCEIRHEAELAIYRIIQELVGNTLKHAQASKIMIDLTNDNSKFYLGYQDNGFGFSSDNIKSGIGMKSIQSRLSLLNSKLEVMEAIKGVHFLAEINLKELKANEDH
jgi:signal transduction histidine kinase